MPPTAGPAVTRRGDLWILGKHRVLCGDAREPADYARLMKGELAAMVFTDPPYNVRISGHVQGRGRVKHDEFAVASGEMSDADFQSFLVDMPRLGGRRLARRRRAFRLHGLAAHRRF